MLRVVRSRASRWLAGGAVLGVLILAGSPAAAQSIAGYSEYYIPGPEGLQTGDSTQLGLWYILDDLDPAGGNVTMHSVIAVTAWSDETTIYYEHWEDGDGLSFDPANPATADETVVLANTGDIRVFESANIPTDGTAGTVYGGGDRIYVAGGTVTVTRSAWIEGRGAGNQAVSWEIYPVKPQLTTYVLPFGENLGGGNFTPFNRVYVLVQATADNTTFQVDFDADGTWDPIDTDRDGTTDTTTVTLQAGETFLVDRVSRGPASTLDTGMIIQGSATLQVKFVTGDPGQTYCARGLSAFPRGFWTTDYYAPLDRSTGGAGEADYYLHNPHASAITVDWQSGTASGTFTIPANTTVSYRAAVGNVPIDSGLYFSGSDVFWGVGINDSLGATYEWGYSLLPSTFLYAEHFLGWAPGFAYWDGGGPGNWNDVGLFLTVAQDNTVVFVDYDNDGVADQTFTLNRLDTQYIYDTTDGDLSQTHIWATGDFTMSYGENGETAGASVPSMDLGYVAIPGTDFISLVLAVDKSVSPQVVPTAAGSTAVFTLETTSGSYPVDAVDTADTLPPSWQYVAGTTTITRPDLTQVTGAAADPAITGSGTAADPYVLTWTSAQLDPTGMAPNQAIVVEFTAQTTAVLPTGTLSRNRVSSTGTRTLGTPSVTQTFSATDFAFVTSGALGLAKTSGAVEPLYPGDQFTYTVTVTNPPGGVTETGVSLYDPIPAGASYVAGTGQVTCLRTVSVRDEFNTPGSPSGNDGTVNWANNWTEANDGANSVANGAVQIMAVPFFGNRLAFQNTTTGGESIQRSATVTGATGATVQLDWVQLGLEADGSDDIVVEYSLDGGPWTVLWTLNGGSANNTTYAANVAFAGVNTFTLRIRALAALEPGFFFTEIATFDNVEISYSQPNTFASGSPPDFLDAGAGCTLPPGGSLTLTFDVTVDDPFPTGQSEITNTVAVTTEQLPVQLTASVTNIVTVPSLLSASVAGRVWFDADADANQDVGEPGIANVEVTLKDQFGTPVAVGVTDLDGQFFFPGVAPGNGYYVEATDGLPIGVTQSFPVGSSDNRTTTFSLLAGDSYTGAYLGYRSTAASVSFGDEVWVDADGDGLRDAGEIGLPGVTVTLYLDDGDGTFEPGTDDSVQATTTSGGGGNYLFPGMTAGQSYFVAVTTPGGYTATTSTEYLFLNVTGGQAYLTADFGFSGAASTLSISDRVWLDEDGNGVFDTGEAGIGSVTVDILDASLQVIGTTITAADGTFSFSGLTGSGADYTIRLTDMAGILTDFTGTTPYAVARERAESNLTASIDRTGAPPAPVPPPSYGFRPTRAIGDTVFFDVDGDGVQDAGEGGIAGVVVSLYADSDGDGLIDGGEPLLGNVTTNAAGQYVFSGLVNGDYIVSVPPPANYTFTGPGSDSDPVSVGIQKSVTLTGSNVLTIDYGFQADTPRSLSGRLWDDANGNGVIDAGESGHQGVTVDVFFEGTLVATLVTDTNGDYSLDGLTAPDDADDYVVRVTDTTNVLSGYEATYEIDGAPLDNEAAVDLRFGDQTAVNFGYRRPLATYASIAWFNAFTSGGSVVVEWRTSLEVGTVGFRLLRFDQDAGRYLRLNRRLLPALLVHPEGGTYRFEDVDAPGRGTLTYVLEEVDIRGKRNRYGPYAVNVADGPTESSEQDWVAERVDVHGRRARPHRLRVGGRRFEAKARPRVWSAAADTGQAERAAAQRRRRARHGQRVKVTTTEPGLHFLPALRLAEALGQPERALSLHISSGQLRLTSRGRVVPYLPATGGAGLYFYAEVIDSIYTDENAYWVEPRPGATMATVPAGPGGFYTPSFAHTEHVEQDLQPLPAFFQNPEADFWAWDYLFAGYPGWDTKGFVVSAPDVAAGSEATLTVRFVGGTDTENAADHRVTVSWNGVVVGQTSWGGITPHTFEVALQPGEVLEGANVLLLAATLGPGVPYSVVYFE
ncbi:MAG: SdrD B-like domain-containing protein, partial [Acidobacteriota bacterium]